MDVSYNRCQFTLIVVDESTRMVIAKDMASKDQAVTAALKHIVAKFAKVPAKPIIIGEGCILHTDSEIVLKSGPRIRLPCMVDRCSRSPPHTHESNAIAERRAIQTIFRMLQQACMPKKFLPVAMHHATHARNLSPISPR